jgi:membrane protease subunit (stomatin/prohibitin family)
MDPIQRPASAPAIFWRQPPGPIPAGTPILVAPSECVVAVLGGAVLGVLAQGSYALHPQALPFLAPSIDAASNVNAELWFVFTDEFRGCKFGGPLTALIDPGTAEQVTPRVLGEYSMKVIDPPAFVKGHLAVTDGAMVVGAVSGEILRKAKEVVARFVDEGHGVLQLPGGNIVEKLRATLVELTSVGLAVQIQSLDFSFSDEDRKRLMAANAAKATAMRAAKVAEMQAQQGATGPTGAAPALAAAAAPLPPLRRNSGLIVGGLVGVVVLASIAAAVLHHSHTQPSAAPQHHGKH